MKKGRTIRKRVLLYSIEIILIAVVGTSLLVSMASYKSIHSMAIQYSDMILSHISESIEVKMKGFDRAVQNICLNTELLKYLNNISAKKNEENHMNINEFLISSMVSDEFIENVQIYSIQPDKISTEFFEERGIYNRKEREVFQEMANQFKKEQKATNVIVKKVGQVKQIIYLFRINDYLTNKCVGVGIMALNTRALEGVFKLIQDEKEIQFLVVDAQNELVCETPFISSERKERLMQQIDYPAQEKSAREYIVAQSELSDYGWKLISQVSISEQMQEVYQALEVIFVLGMLGLVTTLLMNRKLTTLLVYPIEKLTQYMKKVENGEFGVQIGDIAEGELGYAQDQFNHMNLKIADLMQQVIDREQKKRKAEISMLTAQINPHFLYNTLNTISCLAKINGQKQISDITVDLGALLRYSITNSNELVPLSLELQYLEKYCGIMNVRFDGNIMLRTEINDSMMNIMIPRLLFQPIVENAIKYGYQQKKSGCICVRGWQTNEDCVFVIEDDGAGMSKKRCDEINQKMIDMTDSGEIGLQNVNHRIKLYYGQAYGINITSTENVGTQVHLTIGRQIKYAITESAARG